MTARRIQLRRMKGWRLEPNARSVARPGYYGNPYWVGGVYLTAEWLPFPLPTARTWEGPLASGDGAYVRCADVAQAVAWFRQWAVYALEPEKIWLLRGLDLACWCAPGDPCHADVLLELANSEEMAP